MTSPRESSPWGTVIGTGGQYAEARGFGRMYGGNPYAQSELLKVLLGLYKIPMEEIIPNAATWLSQSELKLAAMAIAQTITYFAQQFPEWREETFELDSDFGMAIYHGDNELTVRIDAVIAHVEESKGLQTHE